MASFLLAVVKRGKRKALITVKEIARQPVTHINGVSMILTRAKSANSMAEMPARHGVVRNRRPANH